MKPRISVLIPAYNSYSFVKAAIDSVLAQTLAPCEIIVVNDGVTDVSRSNLSGYLGKVKYYMQDTKSGIAKTYNTGIEIMRGDWLAILDGDDIWHPEKLERQAHLINPETGFIFSERKFFLDDINSAYAAEPYRKEYCEAPLKSLLRSFFASPSTTLIRKSIFESVGVFDESFTSSQDYELWIRIAGKSGYKFNFVPDTLVYKRKHPSSVTGSQPKEEWVDDLIRAITSNKHIFCSKLNMTSQQFSVNIGRSHGFLARKFIEEKNLFMAYYCFRSAFLYDNIAGWNFILRFFWKYSGEPYYSGL